MSYQIYALRLALRAQLRRRGFWLFFILMAALTLFLRWNVQSAVTSSDIRIGLVLPEEGGEDFRRSLCALGSSVIEFVPTDEAAARREVAAGHWDCALVLSADYEERLARRDYESLFTVISSPASALSTLVREPAAAAVARRAAPDIAMAYLQSAGVTDEALLAAARERLAVGLADELHIHVLTETLGGDALDEVRLARLNASRTVRGVLAVALLVWMLFAAVDLIRWRKTAAARRLLPCLSGSALLLPRLLSDTLCAFCAGMLALLAFGEAGAWGAAALAAYLAALGALALLLGESVRSESVPVLLIPFAATACFIFSPVLLDITALYPGLAPLSGVLPVTQYLRAGDGSAAAIWRLLAMTLLFASAAAILGQNARRSAVWERQTDKGRESQP